MKPFPFQYHRPASRDEVDALLDGLGDEGRVLAGGQSLIPMMNMRLASPTDLVDINTIEGEPRDPVVEAGEIVLGPLVRTSAMERSAEVRSLQPLLPSAARFIGHAAIRNRGTVAGSIAHGDPAAELPAVLVLLSGSVRARRLGGMRRIEAADLFLGPLQTSLRAGEWIDEVRFPVLAPGAGVSIAEFSRRHGDFAVCGVAASAEPGEGGRIAVALSYFGMTGPPARVELPRVRVSEASPAWIEEAVASVASGVLESHADLHATAAFRLHLARRLGARAAREVVIQLAASGRGRGEPHSGRPE